MLDEMYNCILLFSLPVLWCCDQTSLPSDSGDVSAQLAARNGLSLSTPDYCCYNLLRLCERNEHCCCCCCTRLTRNS
eukprot:20627-Heterococcus_DN1.PRE.3